MNFLFRPHKFFGTYTKFSDDYRLEPLDQDHTYGVTNFPSRITGVDFLPLSVSES